MVIKPILDMGQQSAIATLLLFGFGVVFLLIGGFVGFQLDTVTAGYGRQRVAFMCIFLWHLV
ncbi:hypothetical protein HacjB3_18198 (plasmid) [Halalkalicoccus jeotgali B3]|uniref:Uncharacterized protein n=1 Tax=Halalkalicoccus jeotgali (strain DSM 18796 / CECT 7217 / JCM 14584 / KCTC 4019 / B3) TaxID=795797 RepID=D8JC44_HALJB|nr:hypothetical protein HacjB3_18043 [Halalkalicoccus jeotgali B3]ADJ16982.1 hypothetical protein HacjB3_18198 [Halalkalicoccus jeotgali B3]